MWYTISINLIRKGFSMEKKMIAISLDNDLLEAVDNFRKEQGLLTHTQTYVTLIVQGLQKANCMNENEIQKIREDTPFHLLDK